MESVPPINWFLNWPVTSSISGFGDGICWDKYEELTEKHGGLNGDFMGFSMDFPWDRHLESTSDPS